MSNSQRKVSIPKHINLEECEKKRFLEFRSHNCTLDYSALLEEDCAPTQPWSLLYQEWSCGWSWEFRCDCGFRGNLSQDIDW